MLYSNAMCGRVKRAKSEVFGGLTLPVHTRLFRLQRPHPHRHNLPVHLPRRQYLPLDREQLLDGDAE